MSKQVELGVDPSAQTEEAYLRVLDVQRWKPDELRVARVARPDLPAALLPRDELPFVGRQPEIEALRTWWAGRGCGARLATVSGESGIGKSRLVREFASSRRPATPKARACSTASSSSTDRRRCVRSSICSASCPAAMS